MKFSPQLGGDFIYHRNRVFPVSCRLFRLEATFSCSTITVTSSSMALPGLAATFYGSAATFQVTLPGVVANCWDQFRLFLGCELYCVVGDLRLPLAMFPLALTLTLTLQLTLMTYAYTLTYITPALTLILISSPFSYESLANPKTCVPSGSRCRRNCRGNHVSVVLTVCMIISSASS